MLKGELLPAPPPSLSRRLLRLVFILRLLSLLLPWVLISGGLIVVGLLAVGPRKNDIPELWICLPAGLALLLAVLVGAPLWIWCKLPKSIQRFEYDGHTLAFAFFAAQPLESRAVEDILSVSDHVQHRKGFTGYRITFREGSQVFLSRRVTHAQELATLLKAKWA